MANSIDPAFTNLTPTPQPAMQENICAMFDTVFGTENQTCGVQIKRGDSLNADAMRGISVLPYGLTFTNSSQPLREDYPSETEWRIAVAVYYIMYGYSKNTPRMLDAQKSKSLYIRNENHTKPEWTETPQGVQKSNFGYHVYNPLFTYIATRVGDIAAQKLRIKAKVTNAAAKSRFAEHSKETAVRYLMAALQPEMYEELEAAGMQPPTQGLTEAVAQYGGFTAFITKPYRDIYAENAKAMIDQWIDNNRYRSIRSSWFKELILSNACVAIPEIDPVTFEVKHGFKYNSETQILDLSAKGDFLEDMQYHVSFDYVALNELLRLYPHLDRSEITNITLDSQRYSAASSPFGIPFIRYQDGVAYFLVVRARWIWTEDAEIDFEEKTDEITETGDFIYVRPSKKKKETDGDSKTGKVNIEGGELHVTIQKDADGFEKATIVSEFAAPPHPPTDTEKDPAGDREFPLGDYIIPRYAVERFKVLMDDQRLEFLRKRIPQNQKGVKKFKRQQVYYTVMMPYHFQNTSINGDKSFESNIKTMNGDEEKAVKITGKGDDLFDEVRYQDQRDKNVVRRSGNIKASVKNMIEKGAKNFSFYGYYELEGGVLPNQVRSADCFAKANLGVIAFVFGNSLSSFVPTVLSRVSGLFEMLQHTLFKWNGLIADVKSDVLIIHRSLMPQDGNGKHDLATYTDRILKNRLVIVDEDMASIFDGVARVGDLVATVSVGLPNGSREVFDTIQQTIGLIRDELSFTQKIGQYETETVARMNANQTDAAHKELSGGFQSFEERFFSQVASLQAISMELSKAASTADLNSEKTYQRKQSVLGDAIDLMYMDGASFQDYAVSIVYAPEEAETMQQIRQAALMKFQSGAYTTHEFLTISQADEIEDALEAIRQIEQQAAAQEQQRAMELQQQQADNQMRLQQEALAAQAQVNETKLSGDLTKEKMKGDINNQNSQTNTQLQALISMEAQQQKLQQEMLLLRQEIEGKLELEKEKNKNKPADKPKKTAKK